MNKKLVSVLNDKNNTYENYLVEGFGGDVEVSFLKDKEGYLAVMLYSYKTCIAIAYQKSKYDLIITVNYGALSSSSEKHLKYFLEQYYNDELKAHNIMLEYIRDDIISWDGGTL